MFDFNNIKFIKTDEDRGFSNYSFVGIQRGREDEDKLEFWLPLGFEKFDDTDFEQVKSFFFKMYRTFKVYLKRKQDTLESSDITNDRDGVIEREKGFSFVNEDKGDVLFYGKLNSLNKILEGYDELMISSLEKKTVRSHEIDYSKLHRYMHQAIYLEDDVIYLDEMNIAKSVLVKNSPPILQLFCFIYSEIKRELEEFESISNKAHELSEKFKENYLFPDSKLFTKDEFNNTVNILKETLELIDIETTYKGEDYWHFYEAIEAFLYGERQEDEKGFLWGFSSFYDIWEDMCQVYVLESPKSKYKGMVVYAEQDGKLKRIERNILKDRLNPFKLRINKGDLGKPRTLRPDLVVYVDVDYMSEPILTDLYYKNKVQVGNDRGMSIDFKDFNKIKSKYPKIIDIHNKYLKKNRYIPDSIYHNFETDIIEAAIDYGVVKDKDLIYHIKIIDYKYMKVSDYINYSPHQVDTYGENKIKDDIQKQLIYEWTVQKNWSSPTESEFWIPFYSNDSLIFEKEEETKNSYINQSRIKIMRINFNHLQDFYIKAFNHD